MGSKEAALMASRSGWSLCQGCVCHAQHLPWQGGGLGGLQRSFPTPGILRACEHPQLTSWEQGGALSSRSEERRPRARSAPCTGVRWSSSLPWAFQRSCRGQKPQVSATEMLQHIRQHRELPLCLPARLSGASVVTQPLIRGFPITHRVLIQEDISP